MKTRSSIRTDINALYRRKLVSWLTARCKEEQDPPKEFPVAIYLEAPLEEKDIIGNESQFDNFCKSWKQPLLAGRVEFITKEFAKLGKVEIPVQLLFNTPEEAAKWAGNLIEYQTAVKRLDVIKNELPQLLDSALNVISSISNLTGVDFTRFVAVCKWLVEHKNSSSLIRAISVRGVDTRWFEINRHLIIDFLRPIFNLSPLRKDLIQLGLLPPPRLITIRILDHALRVKVGGLSILASNKEELEKLSLKPLRVIFIDDPGTVMMIPEMPGTVLVLAQNDSHTEAGQISWIANAKCQYLGSISLNSFARLHNLRLYLPGIESLLMNEETLLDNKDLLTYDDVGTFSGALNALNQEESWFYEALLSGSYGRHVRLDLERLPLDAVFQAVGVKDLAASKNES